MRYAFALRKSIRSDLQVGVHLVYLDLGDAAIDARFFSGDFGANRVFFVAVSFNWLLEKNTL